MKRWIYGLLVILCSAVFLISAYFLGSYLWESWQQKKQYDDLAQLVQQATTPTSDKPSPTTDGADLDVTAPTESPWVAVTDPKTGETVLVLPEYAELYTMNRDLVGWLKIDDTPINYPVMQTPDRPDYYLERDFNKNYSVRGCLYAQENCDVAAPSDNIIVYGHHIKDGSMFGSLMKFKKESFWREHPTFTFDTLTEHHTYEILSVFLTTASQGQGFSYHTFVDAANAEDFDAFVRDCKALSLYDTGVTASYGDKLITLSTCEYSQTNGRLVIVAKRSNSTLH